MDRIRVKAIGSALDEALKEIGQKYGVELKHGTITYTTADFRCKVTCFDKEATGGKDELEVAFETAVKRGKVPGSWFGKTFEFEQKGGMTTGTIVGFKPKSWKRPIIVEDPTGKRWKFEVAQVRSMMHQRKQS